jgi:hypothetical protein
MGEVAQLRDDFKMCPTCRYSPIIHYKPDGATSELVEIQYPFGFKDHETPVMTEIEFI